MAINNINQLAIQLFPSAAQQVEQGQKQFLDAMQATTEAVSAQHLWNVASFLLKAAGELKVAVKL